MVRYVSRKGSHVHSLQLKEMLVDTRLTRELVVLPVDGRYNETVMNKSPDLWQAFYWACEAGGSSRRHEYWERAAQVMRQGIDETKIPRNEGAKIGILKSRWYSDVVE
jgi:hypothetical protein